MMPRQQSIDESAISASAPPISLTGRQVEVLQLAARGLSGKQIARHLGISVRTVEDHFSAMRQRTGAHSQGELIAYGTATGLVRPRFPVPQRHAAEVIWSKRPTDAAESPLFPRPTPGIRDETADQGHIEGPACDETPGTSPGRACQVCGQPIIGAGTGRPRSYCSRACQARAYRARKQA
jgi:DNA-binding CsgD family transcriptional regulator